MILELYEERLASGFLKKCKECGKDKPYKDYRAQKRKRVTGIRVTLLSDCSPCERAKSREKDKKNAASKKAIAHTGPKGLWGTFLCGLPPTEGER